MSAPAGLSVYLSGLDRTSDRSCGLLTAGPKGLRSAVTNVLQIYRASINDANSVSLGGLRSA